MTAPDIPSVTVNGTTTTTISLYWSISNESVVDRYVVQWERDTSGDCENEDEGSITVHSGSTSYTITGLEEDSRYTISVEAANGAGSAISNHITARTLTTSNSYVDIGISYTTGFRFSFFCSSICLTKCSSCALHNLHKYNHPMGAS